MGFKIRKKRLTLSFRVDKRDKVSLKEAVKRLKKVTK